MSFEDIEKQEREWAIRASTAQAKAAHAFERLLGISEQTDTGQARRVAQFLASTYDGQTFPFDPFNMRAVDVSISDDMLACLDALRWAKADLHKLVPEGERRVRSMCKAWGISGPG